MKKKICVVTSSRADYNHLFILLESLKKSPRFDLKVIITGMHTLTSYGNTYKEVIKDGFTDNIIIRTNQKNTDQKNILNSMSTQLNKSYNAIEKINPEIKIVKINSRVDADNIFELVADQNIIADGSDNFKTRFLVADTCFKLKKTLISAAITKYEGQISTWKNKKRLPCYRCLFANEPNDNNINNCSSNGVLGSIGGVFGSLQATEVIKEILNIGNSLSGYLNIYDLLNNTFRKIKINKDPNCKFCSNKKNG